MTPRGFLAVGLTGILACGMGETTTEPEAVVSGAQAEALRITVPLVPTVDGFVHNALTVIDRSIVQALNVPATEDRGIVEFDMRSITGPVLKATLVLRVFASNGPYPFRIDLYGYRGNGILEGEDWARGTPITSFQYAGDSLVKLDVTAKVRAMRSRGVTHAGFVFRFTEPSDIALNGPFVAFRSLEFGPAAKLRILTQ